VISYVLPTRNRPDALARTLAAIGSLPPAAHEPVGGAEVVVVDNASVPPAAAPTMLDNALPVRVLHRGRNEGAAGRNAGVQAAQGDWIVMLDDDSAPTDAGFVDALRTAPTHVLGVAAEIFLPDGGRESGGLPEVFIGCGAAIRRDAFLAAGGYDPPFHYYAEEYDLVARLIRAGGRVRFDRRFRVRHEKAASGRDMNVIMRRLVRNNAWVALRYAPAEERGRRLRETLLRYGAIARREGALRGYAHGVAELLATARRQPRAAMSREQWDRFTGLAAAREGLAADPLVRRAQRPAIVERGKHDWCVEQALREMGKTIVSDPDQADAFVIGTLSPGPMLDASERLTALGLPAACAWRAMCGEADESCAPATSVAA